MKQISIEKVTLNVGTGKPGPELEKAKLLLEKLTGRKPVETLTKKRIPGWGLRPNLPIGCKVTLRGQKADEMVRLLLQAKDSLIDERSFDQRGNFAFGIREYLEIPRVQYIPEVGIIGLEVAVTLQRKGFRVKRRARRVHEISARHAIGKDEAIVFAQQHLNIQVVKKSEGEEE